MFKSCVDKLGQRQDDKDGKTVDYDGDDILAAQYDFNQGHLEKNTGVRSQKTEDRSQKTEEGIWNIDCRIENGITR